MKSATTKTVSTIAPALLAACGGGGSSATPVIAPPPIIAELTVDLSNYVGGTLAYAQPFSEGYALPAPAALSQFEALLSDLLNQQINTVAMTAPELNFELVSIVDSGAGNNELYCLRERLLKGQGFYCVDFDDSDPRHISAPHPLHDQNTNTEAVVVMRQTGAQFLSISTSHRCANAGNSICSGTTTACGSPGPYKVSDAAHNVDSYLYRFGKVVHDHSSAPTTIQLHGCGSAACPSNQDSADIVARLSNGSLADLAGTELVNLLNANLNQQLTALQMGASLSCNEPSTDKQLCGTTNPLGRYINGQVDPCQNAATSFVASRWLHVEQNANLRVNNGAGDTVHPGLLADAINDAMGGN